MRAALRRLDRQRAPAAADLEQALAGLEIEAIQQDVDLAELRVFEAVALDWRTARSNRSSSGRARRNRSRCRGRNVRRCSSALCAAHCRVGDARARSPSGTGLWRGRIAERPRIHREQLEYLDRIGARPFAEGPGLVPADRARSREADKRHPAADLDDRAGALRMKTELAFGAVGKRRIDAADGRRLSISSSTFEKPGDATRARVPPPVAKPGPRAPDVLRACSCRRSYEFIYRLSSGIEKRASENRRFRIGTANAHGVAIEALIGQIGCDHSSLTTIGMRDQTRKERT